MRDLAGRTAIVTGASRGIGPYLARALARERVNLVLAARSQDLLAAEATKLLPLGVRVATIACDVGVADDRQRLVDGATDEFGPVDILVNNAGIELMRPYETLPPEEIERLMCVNLVAPMLLARALIPGMLERGAGFIVNIASLAGKVGGTYGATYSASKAGLVLFTEGLRYEYRKRGVSAAVICPGFVSDAGMYANVRAETGAKAARLIGESSPQKVAAAMITAIKKDRLETIVNPGPMRLNLAVRAAAPGFFEWIAPRLGSNATFEAAVEARRAAAAPGPPDTTA